MSLFLRTLGYNELTCPIKEKHKLIRENVLSVHTGVICPPKLSLGAPNTKGHTKQANWLLDWVDVPYEWNRVHQLLEVCQFLVSTAKHWGAAGATTVNLEENTIGTNDPSIPRSGPASHQQQGTCLAKPNNYWVQACSAHHTAGQCISEMRGWGKEETLFKSNWPRWWHAAAAAAKSLQSGPTLCDPIDSSSQSPPSLGFSRQEH